MSNILRKDHGIIKNRITGQNVTQQILDATWLKIAKRPPRVSTMAKEAGLDKLYEMFYVIMSLLAHGTDTRSLLEHQSDLPSASVEAARTFLEAIYLIVVNRVRRHRSTTLPELEAILHMIFVR
jgi:hypothetical protein